MSINKFRAELEELVRSLANKSVINTFFWGDLNTLRAYKEIIPQYPLCVAYTTGGNVATNTNQIQIVLEVCDKMYSDWNMNLNEIESDTHATITMLFNAINSSRRWQKIGRIDQRSASMTKFVSENMDVVAGWRMTFSFTLKKQMGVCDMPFHNYDFNPKKECATFNVLDSDGKILRSGAIRSGDHLDISI